MKRKLPEQKKSPSPFAFFFALLLVSSIIVCHRSSPETELLNSLQNCLQAVNEHNLSALKELITSDYSDFAGNDRREILNMLSTYFRNYPQFRAKILGRKVKLNPTKNSASIHCDVSLVASAGGFSVSLFNSTQSLLRVELNYRRQNNKWLIDSANWREIGLEEILPETIPHLPKTIFGEKTGNRSSDYLHNRKGTIA